MLAEVMLMTGPRALSLLLLLIALGSWHELGAATPDSTGPVEVTPTISMVLTSVPAAERRVVSQLSKVQRETMHRNVIQRRERLAALVDNRPPSPPGRESRPSRETEPRSQAEFHGTPGNLSVLRNTLNSVAQDGTQSTLLEPTTVNEGNTAIYTGNRFFSYSTDGGASWTEEAIPAGSANAPFFCCDADTVYDAARGIFVWSALYCSDIDCLTTGSVFIFVRRTAAGGNVCSYEIDYTALFNEFPDYPHLGISNKFGYVSVNSFAGNNWSAADMWRFDLDQIADCEPTVTANLFSYTGSVGQRVFVPGSNAQHAMYWAASENTTQLRVSSGPRRPRACNSS